MNSIWRARARFMLLGALTLACWDATRAAAQPAATRVGARLYGKDYTQEELVARVGDLSQIAGVRLCQRSDGIERGVRTAEFRTGSGLSFVVLLDRGMDLGNAEYCGQPIAWMSPTGDVSPFFFEEPGTGWLRSFHGGLLATCGLTYAGGPTLDKEQPLGLHGRISNLPASNIYADAAWRDGKYEMWVQGKVREVSVMGENIELTRRISATLGESKIRLHDTVTNRGTTDTEHMILYHCNIGFPVLDAGTRLIAPVASSIRAGKPGPVDPADYATLRGPDAAWKQKVYYHEMTPDADGNVTAALVNPGFNNGQGFGVTMTYPKRELPRFAQWIQTGEKDYVIGMEPANCTADGRAAERERGTLQFLKPGETREYHLEFGVVTSKEEIEALEAAARRAVDAVR